MRDWGRGRVSILEWRTEGTQGSRREGSGNPAADICSRRFDGREYLTKTFGRDLRGCRVGNEEVSIGTSGERQLARILRLEARVIQRFTGLSQRLNSTSIPSVFAI